MSEWLCNCAFALSALPPVSQLAPSGAWVTRCMYGGCRGSLHVEHARYTLWCASEHDHASTAVGTRRVACGSLALRVAYTGGR